MADPAGHHRSDTAGDVWSLVNAFGWGRSKVLNCVHAVFDRSGSRGNRLGLAAVGLRCLLDGNGLDPVDPIDDD